MTAKMKGPEGHGGLSHGENSYAPDAEGYIEIPEDLIGNAFDHGFSIVADETATAASYFPTAEELQAANLSKMNKKQLVDFGKNIGLELDESKTNKDLVSEIEASLAAAAAELTAEKTTPLNQATVRNNLTTLSHVSAWLGNETVDDNFPLERLIGAASRAIHAYLDRPNLLQHTYSEVYNGSGSGRMMLRQWPVLSVASLSVGTQNIGASPAYGQQGFFLSPWDGYPPGSPQMLDLRGHTFCMGVGNVAVSYTAGYVVQGEPQTIPSSLSVNAEGPHGSWASDSGVTFFDGAPLTPVKESPSAGQYSVAKGKYTFAAADAGKVVLISYSFIPADIEQACIEIVGERYRTKDRIGQTSKSLGGQETVAFSTKSMNDTVREMLQPFRRVVPC